MIQIYNSSKNTTTHSSPNNDFDSVFGFNYSHKHPGLLTLANTSAWYIITTVKRHIVQAPDLLTVTKTSAWHIINIKCKKANITGPNQLTVTNISACTRINYNCKKAYITHTTYLNSDKNSSACYINTTLNRLISLVKGLITVTNTPAY